MTQLRTGLKALLDTVPGATVYGDGPGKETWAYPVILYEKSAENVKRADNIPYDIVDGYLVTVIEREADTPVANLVRLLPAYVGFNRHFVSENLHHTVYTIFF